MNKKLSFAEKLIDFIFTLGMLIGWVSMLPFTLFGALTRFITKHL